MSFLLMRSLSIIGLVIGLAFYAGAAAAQDEGPAPDREIADCYAMYQLIGDCKGKASGLPVEDEDALSTREGKKSALLGGLIEFYKVHIDVVDGSGEHQAYNEAQAIIGEASQYYSRKVGCKSEKIMRILSKREAFCAKIISDPANFITHFGKDAEDGDVPAEEPVE